MCTYISNLLQKLHKKMVELWNKQAMVGVLLAEITEPITYCINIPLKLFRM